MILAVWALLLILQQLSQTLSMRSRMSDSYVYHGICATLSNGIWFVSQLILVDSFVKLINKGDVIETVSLGAFYITWTVFGSVIGMKVAKVFEKRL